MQLCILCVLIHSEKILALLPVVSKYTVDYMCVSVSKTLACTMPSTFVHRGQPGGAVETSRNEGNHKVNEDMYAILLSYHVRWTDQTIVVCNNPNITLQDACWLGTKILKPTNTMYSYVKRKKDFTYIIIERGFTDNIMYEFNYIYIDTYDLCDGICKCTYTCVCVCVCLHTHTQTCVYIYVQSLEIKSSFTV